MRRRIPAASLLLAVVVAACSDAPTGAPLRPIGTKVTLTLTDYIQEQIEILLPRGFESSVDARWSTVRAKKAAGDFNGAVQHLNTLATWIDRKAGDITPPAGETKQQAAARLILNMARWVYDGENAPINEVNNPDAVVEVVPANTPAEITTPSDKAGVAIGPQLQDRIIVIHKEEYEGKCTGPLNTNRCQYPLFYKFDSFPKEKLAQAGRFAVCLVTTGDRRPLDPDSESEEEGPVHERMRLAHNKPANESDLTPGSTVEGDIEILPLADNQVGLVDCDAPSVIGMNAAERTLYAVSRFVGKIISPKPLYAYDSGPEHDSFFFSNFNAVDPESQPDVSLSVSISPSRVRAGGDFSFGYIVNNTSPHTQGASTAASELTTAQVYLSTDNVLDLGGEFGDTPLGTATAIGALLPDQNQSVTNTLIAPTQPGSYYLITAVSPNGGLADPTLANNVVATPITVDPDFVGIFNGTITLTGATSGQPATIIITSQSETGVVGEFRVAEVNSTVAYNQTRVFTSSSIVGSALNVTIDPFTSPFSSAIKVDFTLTRTENTLSGPTVRTLAGGTTDTWDNLMELSPTPLVAPPPPPLVGLRASIMAKSMAAPGVLF